MKHLFLSIVTLLMCAVGFTACNNDDDTVPSLVKTTWDFGDVNRTSTDGGVKMTITATRHLTFLDEKNGILKMVAKYEYAGHPEWNETVTCLSKFEYIFDGTSGNITNTRFTMLYEDDNDSMTMLQGDGTPDYLVKLGKDANELLIADSQAPEDISSMKKLPFEKVQWVEKPALNSGDDDGDDDGDGNKPHHKTKTAIVFLMLI